MIFQPYLATPCSFTLLWLQKQVFLCLNADWLAMTPVVRKQVCVIDMHFLEYLSITIDKQTIAHIILSQIVYIVNNNTISFFPISFCLVSLCPLTVCLPSSCRTFLRANKQDARPLDGKQRIFIKNLDGYTLYIRTKKTYTTEYIFNI